MLAHPVLVVVLVVIAVRVAAFLAFNDVFAFDRTGVVHGSGAYLTYAENLLATGVYGKITPGVADAHLPPLYSYVLAGLWRIASGGVASSLVVAGLHIALDSVAAGCLVWLCARLFARHGRAIGLIAGLCYACYPYLVFQNLTLIDTPLFMALLYAFLACIVSLAAPAGAPAGALKRSLRVCLLAGLLLGLMGLARPNAALFALAAGAWLWSQVGGRAALVRLAAIGLVAALTLAPWIAHTASLFGQFVPVALNGGENFYQGNNAYTVPFLRAGYDPQWVPAPPIPVFADEFGPAANDARMALGWQFLREHPNAIPGLLFWKLVTHWSIDIAPRNNPTAGVLPRPDYVGDAVIDQAGGGLTIGALPPGDPVGAYSGGLFDLVGRPVHMLYFGGLLLLAVAGLWQTRRAWRVLWLLYAMQIVNTLLYVVFHPSTRYRVPTDPLLFAFSAAALVWLFERLRARPNAPLFDKPA